MIDVSIINSEQQILSKLVKTNDWGVISRNALILEHFIRFPELAKIIFDYHEQTGKVISEATLMGMTSEVEYLFLEDGFRFEDEEDLASDILVKYFYTKDFAKEANKCIVEAETQPQKAMQAMAVFCNRNAKIIFNDKLGKSYLENHEESLERLQRSIDMKDKIIKTGISELDTAIGGYRTDKELMAVVGRMNEGKSWFVLWLAVLGMKQGKRVFYYSGETPREQVEFRISTLLFNYPNFDLIMYNLTDSDYKNYKELVEANARKYTGDITIVTPEDDLDNKKLTIESLRGELNKENYDIIVIDQLSEMETLDKAFRGNTKLKYKQITDELAHLSSEMHIPVVLACQANRETQDGELKDVPGLKEIADSDDIARVATTVIGMCQLEGPQLKIKVTKARFVGKDTELYYAWDINHGIFEFVGDSNNRVSPKPKNRQQNERRERQNKHEEQSYEDVF